MSNGTATRSAGSLPKQLYEAASLLVRCPFEPWRFGDSIAFDALEMLSDACGDERWASFAYGFARGWAATKPDLDVRDKVAPGRAMVSLAMRYGDSRLVDLMHELAEVLLSRRRVRGVLSTHEEYSLRLPASGVALPPGDLALLRAPGAGVSVDVLHFDPPLLTSLGRALNDPRLVELGVTEAIAYCELLQDPDTGIFSHFFLERSGRSYGYGWSRGQGWAFLGLIEVLHAVTPTHQMWHELCERLVRLLVAMCKAQRPDGHWPVLIADPSSVVETSAAAFYVAAIERLVADGRIPLPSEIVGAAERAWQAVVDAWAPSGLLDGVTAAVGACTEDSHHNGVPRGGLTPWGQGALVAAAAGRLANGKPAVGECSQTAFSAG